MNNSTSWVMSSKFLYNKIKVSSVYKLNVLWIKLTITQLTVIVASIYASRTIGQHGALQYAGYSLVSQINLTSYVIIMISLQPIYFLAGRQLGQQRIDKYNHVMWAGLITALFAGVLITCVIIITPTGLTQFKFDNSLIMSI